MVERGLRNVAEAQSEVTIEDRRDLERPSRRRLALRRRSPRQSRTARASRRSRNLFKVLGKLWIPLVLLVVMVAGGFTVSRLHGVFGSEKRVSYADTRKDVTRPFNPKHLTYEVFGPPGTVADISYFDVNGEPQFVHAATLPWSQEFAITAAAGLGNIAAQGDSDSIGCRILVDGVVKSEKVTEEVHAFAFCVLKAT